MSEVIYKYKLDRETTLELPSKAEILSAYQQNDEIFIWAKINLSHILKERHFICAMTGENLPYGVSTKFIDTVHLNNGVIVVHIFEVIK